MREVNTAWAYRSTTRHERLAIKFCLSWRQIYRITVPVFLAHVLCNYCEWVYVFHDDRQRGTSDYFYSCIIFPPGRKWSASWMTNISLAVWFLLTENWVRTHRAFNDERSSMPLNQSRPLRPPQSALFLLYSSPDRDNVAFRSSSGTTQMLDQVLGDISWNIIYCEVTSSLWSPLIFTDDGTDRLNSFWLLIVNEWRRNGIAQRLSVMKHETPQILCRFEVIASLGPTRHISLSPNIATVKWGTDLVGKKLWDSPSPDS